VPKREEHNSDLYFLHQLYDVIKTIYPQHLEEFKKRCADNNMKGFIESYEEYLLKQ
jgi:hypothetical protein